MEREILSCLVLSGLKGIGSRTFKALVDEFGSGEMVLSTDKERVAKFGKTVVDVISSVKEEDFEKAYREMEKAQKLNIRIIPYTSGEYPRLLKSIPDPPPVLYVKGNSLPDENLLSVVGTRKPSNYGRYVVENLLRPAIKEGICVVSGMATGIDYLSHSVALEEGGVTVAVLGSGVDVVYPPESRKLYDRIQENGCVISELPIGTKPSKYTFPSRNRIIAALSYVTFIVEAPDKSGSLITAQFAHQYSRLVLTVPGNINMPTLSGNNSLIRQGIAVPITSLEDLYTELPFLRNRENSSPYLEGKKLSELEVELLNFLVVPKHTDEILERFNFDSRVDEALIGLVLKGMVQEEGGYYYRAG